jgi:DNA-binding FadR family transcriptional regulator
MSLQTPTRGIPLSAQVAEQVEGLITSGAWPVGTRIPPEAALVERLRVSRNTVREALRSLVHTGMLEARPGDGTYVRMPSELAAPLVRRARRARLADAVEVRSLLEQQAARLAALRRSGEDVRRLRGLLERQRRASEARDRAAYAEADAALHRAVVAASGNAFLTEIYEYLGGALKLSVSPELWDQMLADEEVRHHAALVDAIAAGNAAAAERAAQALVEALRDALLAPPLHPAKRRNSRPRAKAR